MVRNRSFVRNGRGRSPRALADIGRMDADLFAMAPAKARDARIIATIVGGKLVYSAK